MIKVAIILMHELPENRDYFDLALKAALATEGIEFNIFLMTGYGVMEDLPKSDKFSLIHFYTPGPSTHKMHAAIDFIKEKNLDFTHFLMLSDDVIISKHMVRSMIDTLAGREMLMNPFSNSDCTSMYDADIQLPGNGMHLRPDMQLKDFYKGFEDQIMNYPAGPRLIVPFGMISFYCTMIPRSVWDKVGRLDIELEYRHNDQDYCLRARKFNIPSVVSFGSFAFHFGSRTLRTLATDEMKDKCTEYFKKKWDLQ